MKSLFLISLLSFTFLLQGCAPTISSSVTAFHDYGTSRAISKGSVYISGSNEEQKVYAQHVSEGFQKHGFFQAANKKAATYTATVTASIDNGREVNISSPVIAPVSGGLGFGRTVVYGRHGRAYYTTTYVEPTQYAVVGQRNYTVMVYKCKATVKLLNKNGGQVWEGRATSQVQTSDLYQVAPAIIDAILKDFPAKSGQTREVRTSIN